jgi:hypothetical protein
VCAAAAGGLVRARDDGLVCAAAAGDEIIAQARDHCREGVPNVVFTLKELRVMHMKGVNLLMGWHSASSTLA